MDESPWSSEAEIDIAQIALYMSIDAPRAAERFLEAVDDAGRFVRANPGLGHLHRDIRPPWKVYRFRHWLLIYDPTGSPVCVGRVIHASRDLTKLRL